MGQIIKRGIIQSFNNATYTASILLLEATSTFLTGVPISTTVDGTSGLAGALCAVLFFDQHNPQDAVIVAVYPNGSQGVPSPAPGRVTFVTGFQQINAVTINSGVTQTFTLTGGSSGIPIGALGVVYKAYFTCASANAFIRLAPHGASDISAYATIGNLTIANAYMNTTGLLQIDASGKIDIQANVGACTVTLFTHGYVV